MRRIQKYLPAILVLSCLAFQQRAAHALETPGPDTYTQEKIQALIKDLGNDDFDKRQNAEKELAKAGTKAQPALTAAQKSTDAQVKATAERLLGRIKYAAMGPVKYVDVLPANSLVAILLTDIGASIENGKKSALGKMIAMPELAPFVAKVKAGMDENPEGTKQALYWLERFKGQIAASVWEMNFAMGPAGIKAAVVAEITDPDPKLVFDEFVKQTGLIQPGAQTLVYKDVDIQENAQKQGALALAGKHMMLGANADCLKQLIDNMLAPGGGLGSSASLVKAKESLGAKPELLFVLDFEAYMKAIAAMMAGLGQAEQLAGLQSLMSASGQEPKWMAISSAAVGDGYEDRYVVLMKGPPKGLAAGMLPPAGAEAPLNVMSLVPPNAVIAAIGYLDGPKIKAGMTDYLASLQKMMDAQPGGANPFKELFTAISAFEGKSGIKLTDMYDGLKGEIGYWAALAPGAPALPDAGIFLTFTDADKAKLFSDSLKKAANAAAAAPLVRDTPAGARTFCQIDVPGLIAAAKEQAPKAPAMDDGEKLLATLAPTWSVDGNRVFFASTPQALKKQFSFIDAKMPGLITQPDFIKALGMMSPLERKGQVLYIDFKKLLSYAQINGLPLLQMQLKDEAAKKALAGLPPPDQLFKDITPILMTSVVDGDVGQSVVRAPVPPIPTLILAIFAATAIDQQRARPPVNAPPGGF